MDTKNNNFIKEVIKNYFTKDKENINNTQENNSIEQGFKFTLYIGLKEKDMQTKLNYIETLNKTRKYLNALGVLGFNKYLIKGEWESTEEDTLKIEFINTFGLHDTQIYKLCQKLAKEFNQECVLFEKSTTLYNFVGA